jgi:hypothetical protein
VCPSNVSARCASSRIVSRIVLSGVSDSATVSIPVVEAGEDVWRRISPIIAGGVFHVRVNIFGILRGVEWINETVIDPN